MKKFIAVLMGICLISGIIGCSSGAATVAKESAVKEAENIRVGIIYTTTGRGDLSFNDATFEGAERAIEAFGIKVDHTEPKSLSEMEMALEDMSASGSYDLIIGVTFEIQDAMSRIAVNYPDQKYAIVDVTTDLENVNSYIAKENEAAFLVGAYAGLLNLYKPDNGMVGDANVVGVIGAVDADVVNRHFAGFTSGAKYVNPDIEVLSDYVGDFSDTATAQTIAETMNKMGADVIYNAAAGAGLGLFKAAADKNFIAIGLDSNQNTIDPDHIAASSIKKVDEFIYSAISEVVNGSFKGGETFILGLKENGVGYTTEGSHIQIDSKVVDIVEDIKGKIIAGEIQIPAALDEIESFIENNQYKE